jgi:hypothetical protein
MKSQTEAGRWEVSCLRIDSLLGYRIHKFNLGRFVFLSRGGPKRRIEFSSLDAVSQIDNL